MKSTVSIQGKSYSFHDIARQKYFGKNKTNVLHRDTFKEVFKDVATSESDYGLVAIENSLFGSIADVYAQLMKKKTLIVGEVYLRINHCLVGLKGTNLKQIKEIHSQLPALAQCEDWLDKHLDFAERVEEHDTAASVEKVAMLADNKIVAIGSKESAKHHGLEVLAEEIESHKQNYTRFIVISKQKEADSNAEKTSLILRTNHQPGSLYKALGVFARNNINLSKLESRPIIGKAWHYQFYIDIDAGSQSDNTIKTMTELSKIDCECFELGTYKKGQFY